MEAQPRWSMERRILFSMLFPCLPSLNHPCLASASNMHAMQGCCAWTSPSSRFDSIWQANSLTSISTYFSIVHLSRCCHVGRDHRSRWCGNFTFHQTPEEGCCNGNFFTHKARVLNYFRYWKGCIILLKPFHSCRPTWGGSSLPPTAMDGSLVGG